MSAWMHSTLRSDERENNVWLEFRPRHHKNFIGGSAAVALQGVPFDLSPRDELYKNRSSRKIDSQRLFSREYDFQKTFSLTENQFSGKAYFYTIASRLG